MILSFRELTYSLLGYIPWLIAYDYPHNAIMIVIRGTLTPKDFFTDMISMIYTHIYICINIHS